MYNLSYLSGSFHTNSKFDLEIKFFLLYFHLQKKGDGTTELVTEEGKVVADLGCGNGVFGIGALLLGAEKVIFLDVDKKAIELAKKNADAVERIVEGKLSKSFSNKEVSFFNRKVDTVIQNPPFGVKKTHADKPFLLKAMKYAEKVYTFHKFETRRFVEKFVLDEGWKIKLVKKYKFPLRKGKEGQGYAFWKKQLHNVNVGVWLIEGE